MEYLELFKVLFEGLEGYICLAFKKDMTSSAGPKQVFFKWPNEIEQIRAWVEEHKDGNCYFCPHLLSEPTRKKQFAVPGHVLYADLDQCDPANLGNYGEPLPNVTIQTSLGRWQAYWLLEHDVEPNRYEALNHRIALGYKEQGCDQSGWDISQLLRIPGTIHNKGKPFTVKAKLMNKVRSDPDAFKGLPSLSFTSTIHRGSEAWEDVPPVELDSLRIPDIVKQYLISPSDVGDRSESAWAIMKAMMEGGYSPEQVFATIWASPLKARYTAFTLQQDVLRAFEKGDEPTQPKAESEEPTAFVADWRDIHLYLPEEGEPIIEGLLSGGSQSKMQIAGESGIGKTTLGLNMLIPIALPCPVFGSLRVPRRRRATFVDLEAVAVAVQTETILLTKLYGEPERGWLTIIAGEDFKMDNTASMNRLWAKLKEAGSEVVFMDSIINIVTDYNDPIQSKLFREWCQSLMAELHCALILANHMATTIDGGGGHKKAFGALGKLLDKWVANKLAYEEIPGLPNYGRLHGDTRTREWSKVDLLLAYEEDTQVLSLIPWEDIPLPQAKKRKVIGPSPRTQEFQQFMILAKRRKLTGQQIVDMIGVSKNTMYRYNSGEDLPSDATWQRIEEARNKLRMG